MLGPPEPWTAPPTGRRRPGARSIGKIVSDSTVQPAGENFGQAVAFLFVIETRLERVDVGGPTPLAPVSSICEHLRRRVWRFQA